MKKGYLGESGKTRAVDGGLVLRVAAIALRCTQVCLIAAIAVVFLFAYINGGASAFQKYDFLADNDTPVKNANNGGAPYRNSTGGLVSDPASSLKSTLPSAADPASGVVSQNAYIPGITNSARSALSEANQTINSQDVQTGADLSQLAQTAGYTGRDTVQSAGADMAIADVAVANAGMDMASEGMDVVDTGGYKVDVEPVLANAAENITGAEPYVANTGADMANAEPDMANADMDMANAGINADSAKPEAAYTRTKITGAGAEASSVGIDIANTTTGMADSKSQAASAGSGTAGGGIFVWPIEPVYAPLAHDYYLVSGGEKKILGYTHNNGFQRNRHYVYIAGRSHYGFDIAAAPGTAVAAAASGTIAGVLTDYSEATNTSGYGLYIVIDHGAVLDGANVYSVYAHLQNAIVKKGDKVEAGGQIGNSGNSGGSRIPHLHFEFRLGANDHAHNIDPLELLPALDLNGLSQTPAESEGFDRSSVELYRRMADSGWEYEVRVLTIIEKSWDGGVTIPANTELPLLARSDGEYSASVLYEGKIYKYSLDELIYTYN